MSVEVPAEEEVSAGQCRAYRRAARQPRIRVRVDLLLHDVGVLERLTRDGDPTMRRGAAIAVAQAALGLAIAMPVDESERDLRREILLGVVLPALEAAGHDHVAVLITAALARETTPTALVRGSDARQ